MSIRRISVLLGKELRRGPRNFMFIFAIVIPLVLTLIVTLLFGTIFSGKGRLGIVDEGSSQIVALSEEVDSIRVERFDSGAALMEAVRNGAIDVGVILPARFDGRLTQGDVTEITVYVWGESQLQHRVTLATTLAVLFRDVSGQESPVEIVTNTLGDGQNVPWEERLLPFLVLMTILIGGSMVPATMLVEEKQQRTLSALTVTSTSLGEVLTAKGVLGVLLSMVMGVIILILNRAFGTQPGLLLLVLFLGAVMASVFGVILGVFIKDINSLFATIKAVGIVLYAPALIYLFPEIPQWIGYIFPTYYMIQPVVEITQQGAGWAEVLPELLIRPHRAESGPDRHRRLRRPPHPPRRRQPGRRLSEGTS